MTRLVVVWNGVMDRKGETFSLLGPRREVSTSALLMAKPRRPLPEDARVFLSPEAKREQERQRYLARARKRYRRRRETTMAAYLDSLSIGLVGYRG